MFDEVPLPSHGGAPGCGIRANLLQAGGVDLAHLAILDGEAGVAAECFFRIIFRAGAVEGWAVLGQGVATGDGQDDERQEGPLPVIQGVVFFRARL